MLLNYNGTADTLACIDSLLASDSPFRQLIVCDNASTDGSLVRLWAGIRDRTAAFEAAWSRWRCPKPFALAAIDRTSVRGGASSDASVILVDNEKNWGFAGGNNVGLRLAMRTPDIEFCWLLNNDTTVYPDALSALLRASRRRPSVGLWGATVLYKEPAGQVQALGGGMLNRRTAKTRHLGAFMLASEVRMDDAAATNVESNMAYVLGASMFANRSWIERVGLLDERYFLYYEELDWASRATGIMSIGYAPECMVVHKEGASIGTAPSGGSAISVHHLHRSRVLFARRFRSHCPSLSIVLLASVLELAKYCMKGKWLLAEAGFAGLLAGMRPVHVNGDWHEGDTGDLRISGSTAEFSVRNGRDT
uniref:glycosyltransferase family 2 protein n=1 Tax=Caballeronia sp. LjRoot34 TaxID=3342325 RepID=UPI003F50760B